MFVVSKVTFEFGVGGAIVVALIFPFNIPNMPGLQAFSAILKKETDKQHFNFYYLIKKLYLDYWQQPTKSNKSYTK